MQILKSSEKNAEFKLKMPKIFTLRVRVVGDFLLFGGFHPTFPLQDRVIKHEIERTAAIRRKLGCHFLEGLAFSFWSEIYSLTISRCCRKKLFRV